MRQHLQFNEVNLIMILRFRHRYGKSSIYALAIPVLFSVWQFKVHQRSAIWQKVVEMIIISV